MPTTITIDMDGCPGCCGIVPCLGLQCRVAGAAAPGYGTICGYEEFASPSLPPKKYRKRTWTCDFTNHSHSVLGCPHPTPSHAITYHKSSVSPPCECIFDASTCANTGTGDDRFGGQGGILVACDPLTSALTNVQAPPSCGGGISSPFASGGYTSSISQTTALYTGTQICVNTGPGSSNCYNGVAQFDLTNEDTIFDAIARTGYGSWSAWGDCGTNYSFISVREAGDFTSTYAKAQARRCCSLLTIGTEYTATLHTQMRITGSSDDWVPGPDVTISFTPESTDECVVIDVPLLDQYEIQATEMVIIPP